MVGIGNAPYLARLGSCISRTAFLLCCVPICCSILRVSNLDLVKEFWDKVLIPNLKKYGIKPTHTPEDIQYIALPVLTHRIILTPEAEMEGITTEEVIRQILAEIEIPR